MTTNAPRPDGMDGATAFIETAEHPIACGRWYVRPDDTVAYQHPDGHLVRSRRRQRRHPEAIANVDRRTRNRLSPAGRKWP